MKIIKIILVSILLVLVIFFLGAFLLPERQHIAEKRVLNTDPVAVYTHLKDTLMVKKIFNEVLADHSVNVKLNKHKEFTEVLYRVYVDGKKEPVDAVFLLNEEEEGTEITAYIRLDTLKYPYGRWKGFFIPIVYRSSAINFINKLEAVVMQ